jgi:opacity protein-like surface antigen
LSRFLLGTAVQKKVLTGLAALTLLDLSAELANAQNWQGPYAGLDIGYRSGSAGLTAPGFTFVAPGDPGGIFTSPARAESYSPNGLVGGAHIGYNFLIHPSLLVGIEADVMATSGSETATVGFLSTDGVAALRTSKAQLGTRGTIRGRVGYVTESWLVYATGGVAFTRFTWSDTVSVSPPFAATFPAAVSDTLTGWTVGGGVERAVNSYLTVRVQYLYEDFGTETVPLAATSQTGRLSITAQKLTFGGSFKF